MSDPDCMESQIACKADWTQEHHLLMSTKNPHLPIFVKPHKILNLAIQNVFYKQSYVESTFMYNLELTILYICVISMAFLIPRMITIPLGTLKVFKSRLKSITLFI